MSTDDSGPAFPGERVSLAMPQEIADKIGDSFREIRTKGTGLTIRQYAAIHLRVPQSGLDWLDEMIREARGSELAYRDPVISDPALGKPGSIVTGRWHKGEFIPDKPDYYDGEWHKWEGGECPVENDTLMQAELRCGEILETSPADCFEWAHTGEADDIIRFRVVTW